jgi:hypothetical protein
MSILLTEVKNGEVYTGYDNQISSICTPNFQIIRSCLQATLKNREIFLKVDLVSARIDMHQVIKSETFKIMGPGSFKVQLGFTGTSVKVLQVVAPEGGFVIDLEVKNYFNIQGKVADGPTYRYQLELTKLKATEEMRDTEITHLLAQHLLNEV